MKTSQELSEVTITRSEFLTALTRASVFTIETAFEAQVYLSV